MNRFHPIYHGTSTLAGSRIGIERLMPPNALDLDDEALIDLLSEPPHFVERVAPVRTQIGEDIIRGKNWTDLMVKTYRWYGRMWSRLGVCCKRALRDGYKEKGMLPFTSVCIDPDTLHRIIESDYEAGENTYANLMQLFSQGVIAPCATVPFGLALPLLESDFDWRVAIRMGLNFYAPIIEQYHEHIEGVHGEKPFVMLFWLPETAYCCSSVRVLCQEFKRFCEEREIDNPHLVLFLDSAQSPTRDTDALMKMWNSLELEGLEGIEVSTVFRDRAFSEWVSYSAPSVKKLLDRTIAKVDSTLNAGNVNYCWGHYEDLEALTHSPKAASNFEQKILKLIELGYLPLSADVYIRRKLNGRFSKTDCEPRKVRVRDMSSGADWTENAATLSRLLGFHENGAGPKVQSSRSYTRITKHGELQEEGHQCWKIASNAMRRNLVRKIRGDVKTVEGGVLGILRSLLPPETSVDAAREKIQAFLAQYAYIYWREHFIQHDFSEAEINLQEILAQTLFSGRPTEATAIECAIAGTAAQTYCFMLDGNRAVDLRQVNFDQRAVYQNVVMLTLALCNLMQISRWRQDKDSETAWFSILDSELLNFESAYERYHLEAFGVSKEDWTLAIRSHIENSALNIVERAARKTAAQCLRPLGYRNEFSREDEALTTNVGHLWESEVHNPNYRWENHYFCGRLEE